MEIFCFLKYRIPMFSIYFSRRSLCSISPKTIKKVFSLFTITFQTPKRYQYNRTSGNLSSLSWYQTPQKSAGLIVFYTNCRNIIKMLHRPDEFRIWSFAFDFQELHVHCIHRVTPIVHIVVLLVFFV